MTTSEKRRSGAGFVAGTTGIALLACMACCLPVLIPIVAASGVTALSLQVSGFWIVLATGAVGAGVWMLRRRRRNAASACSGNCSVGCKAVEPT